jgi:hypothetical protein
MTCSDEESFIDQGQGTCACKFDTKVVMARMKAYVLDVKRMNRERDEAAAKKEG